MVRFTRKEKKASKTYLALSVEGRELFLFLRRGAGLLGLEVLRGWHDDSADLLSHLQLFRLKDEGTLTMTMQNK